MANEYGTLAVLKERLSIEADDTSRDTLLSSALSSASRGIDRATGRRFWLDDVPVVRTYRPAGRVARDADGELLLVDDIGSVTGLVVETGSGTSFTALSSFETSPDNALADGQAVTGLRRVNGTWGTATSRVRVTARFGWPAVPDDITEAADGFTPPAAAHINTTLDFVRRWDRRAPLVVHCFAGISRSTATAFMAVCALNPERDENAPGRSTAIPVGGALSAVSNSRAASANPTSPPTRSCGRRRPEATSWSIAG